jgi:glycerol-3-phosphate acyltransferase PlsY
MNSLIRRVERQTPFNVKRGLVHFTIGCGISITGLLLSHYMIILILAFLAVIWILVDLLRMRFAKLGVLFHSCFSAFLRDYERTRLTGATFLLIGSLLSFVVFDNQVAALSVSFLAVGDPLAHLVRDKLNKASTFNRYLAETSACIAGCVIVGFLLQHFSIMSVNLAPMFAGAVIASAVQGIPFPIDDNLTIPLCSGVTMWLIQILSG